MAASASDGGPAQHVTRTHNVSPCRSSGMKGSGGAICHAKKAPSSRGAREMYSSKVRITFSASSTSKNIGPPMMLFTGWSLYWKFVTTPKLPPPPRSAQKRSGFALLLAVTNEPSARTTSAEIRLSSERPLPRVRYPMPPPSLSPAMPLVDHRVVHFARFIVPTIVRQDDVPAHRPL